MKPNKLIELAFIPILVLLGTGCTSSPEAHIVQLVNQVESPKLRKHVSLLSDIGSRYRWATDDKGVSYWSTPDKEIQTKKLAYITACLESYGYKIGRAKFNAPPNMGGSCINVFAMKMGKTHPDRYMELAAHYDTLETAGADDNCSGVAAVLEVARILSVVKTERSVRFCFFDLEEMGYQYSGSRHHVALIERRELPGETFDGAIICDAIAFTAQKQETPLRIPLLFNPPKTGDFVLVLGNQNSAGIASDFKKASRNYASQLSCFKTALIGSLLKDSTRGDHVSYWEQGLPAILITDTGPYRNPNYHKSSDTIDTLDFDFLTKTTKATVSTLLEDAGIVEDEISNKGLHVTPLTRRP
ncbi:M28 family peptidase [Planctomycetota bacterium]